MRRWSSWGRVALLVFGVLAMGMQCPVPGALTLVAPASGLISAPGDVAVQATLPAGATNVAVRLDGAVQDPTLFTLSSGNLTGTIPAVTAGLHVITVEAVVDGQLQVAGAPFDLLDLEPGCDPLNAIECLLPFPSSHWTQADATTSTNLRVSIPSAATPDFIHLTALPNLGVGELRGFDTAALSRNDGFSPTAQVMMHFTLRPNVVKSDAPRLDPINRHWSDRGLQPSSPTLLFDFDTGEQINHWIENDARANSASRTLTFLRPTQSLIPGRRYLVAVRDLKDDRGFDIEAEAVFRNLRDGEPSDLDAVNERRAALEPVFQRLDELGVDRSTLLLAFEFTVQSDEALTAEMIAMRDAAFSWLDQQVAAETQTFTAALSGVENDCSVPGTTLWKVVEGTFQAPNFLQLDPFTDNRTVAEMNRDANDQPLQNGFTNVPYALSIPCSVFDGEGFAPASSVVLGHGLFGDGPGFVKSVAPSGNQALDVALGGVNWIGLSNNETDGCNFNLNAIFLDCFIARVVGDLDDTTALADRKRQGMLHALLLARMMTRGAFNLDPLIQGPGGQGALAAGTPAGYFGVSLGGIMGTMFAALTPDAQRINVDVPGINFSLLLQRAQPFVPFQLLLDLLINPDPLEQIIGISLSHEIWVRGEPAGYVTHVRGTPLPGVPGPKDVLMTVALYDHQVANLASMISGSTMGLTSHEGSVLKNIPGLPDSAGPQTSAFIVYDAGSFDVNDPVFDEFIPPITNEFVQTNRCDPHPTRATIPASLDQLQTFLETGLIQNFCTDDGLCNGSEPNEIPGGASAPCDPLN